MVLNLPTNGNGIKSSSKAIGWTRIHGRSKSIEDTEKVLGGLLPKNGENTYRVNYAVHRIVDSRSDQIEGESQPPVLGGKRTEFLGHVALVSLDANSLALPEDLTLPTSPAASTLTVEIGYMFLPRGWGQGFATESINAVFDACRRASSFWAPFSSLYVRAIVNDENPASLRVMEKTGVTNRGIYEWTGKPVFLAGRWQEHSRLHIFGRQLLE
ncbi:MAG: hypothetical protein LQ345_000927 [Seirophora villosa]|nr:MAG: hypothetical protein LQ345_000927 [Seirophora villosa]